MNRDLITKYIAQYKADFSSIHKKEIYKWQAVKQFQDTWDPDADDFVEMLSLSLSKTKNLMAAGNYFPREIIKRIATKRTQAIKAAFAILFDEDVYFIDRIATFQEDVNKLNEQLFPGKKSFHDERAVLVYLNLRYPVVTPGSWTLERQLSINFDSREPMALELCRGTVVQG